jgi:hypothetical protein
MNTRRRSLPWVVLAGLVLAAFLVGCSAARPAEGEASALPWWKGLTHMHSRWSDGADFPEMVAQYYKSHGYNFIVTTDHNKMPEGEYWSPLIKQPRDNQRLEEYKKWLGSAEVPTRRQEAPKPKPDPSKPKPEEPKTKQMVTAARVKPLADYRARFEEPGRFLIIPGTEITDSSSKVQVHFVAINVAEKIAPAKAKTIRETLEADLDAVLRQEERLKRPMLPIFAHPNWGGVVPVEDWQTLPGLLCFEVVNEVIASADNTGDERRLSTDRLWDVALAARLTRLGLGTLYGVAADDTHDAQSAGGFGWIMVRAKDLSPESLIDAMKMGEFYASTGVRLKDVRRDPTAYTVEVDPEPGVTYTIQFIGTLSGYNRSKEDAKDDQGALLPPTLRYSGDIGKVLKEVTDTKATYTPTGKELYVRAKILSSKARPGPGVKRLPAIEVAWTQPMVIAPQKK